MVDPIPTTPALTPQDLRDRQTAQLQQRQQQADLDQQGLQQAADRPQKGVFRRVQNRSLRRGSLVAFNYGFYKHDPSPLCLVARIGMNGTVSGVNLHYLTFRYVQQLVRTYCGKEFSYQQVRGNRYVTNAYRSYRREGRSNLRVLDCEFLTGVLGNLKSFRPGEVEAMRQEVQRQLRERMQPSPEQQAERLQQSVFQQSHKQYGVDRAQPDGRFNPTDLTPPE